MGQTLTLVRSPEFVAIHTETYHGVIHMGLGYRRFRCRSCGREFNEHTGTAVNRLQYPSDVVC
jgi:transposase-like protein